MSFENSNTFHTEDATFLQASIGGEVGSGNGCFIVDGSGVEGQDIGLNKCVDCGG